MTDLSKLTLTELDAHKRNNTRALDAYTEQNEAIVAEIERRKSEPDWEAWEPKWQAFRKAMEWEEGRMHLAYGQRCIRALIAAHNTPLAGEDGGWTYWERGVRPAPEGVSQMTHEVQFFYNHNGGEKWEWAAVVGSPCWDAPRYRYRPRQS